MSTISTYHDPEGPMPEDCDPPNYDEAFPIEERMLEILKRVALYLPPDGFIALDLLLEVKGYIKQCIADRDRIDERGHDTDAEFTDPFADE